MTEDFEVGDCGCAFDAHELFGGGERIYLLFECGEMIDGGGEGCCFESTLLAHEQGAAVGDFGADELLGASKAVVFLELMLVLKDARVGSFYGEKATVAATGAGEVGNGNSPLQAGFGGLGGDLGIAKYEDIFEEWEL